MLTLPHPPLTPLPAPPPPPPPFNLAWPKLVWAGYHIYNPLKRKITHRPFEYTLFAIIVFNCGMMALEGPDVPETSPLGLFLKWGNAACTGLFTLELLVKVFAWTFVRYIKEVTNQVDFLVVATGLLELTLTSFDMSVGGATVLRVGGQAVCGPVGAAAGVRRGKGQVFVVWEGGERGASGSKLYA